METPRITQETPQSCTRRIPPACQTFMTDTSVAAVTTARLDRAGEASHCWFIQPAREISRKLNGSRHFDIGSSHYRRRQGLSLAVSDRSSFRAIRGPARRHATRHDQFVTWSGLFEQRWSISGGRRGELMTKGQNLKLKRLSLAKGSQESHRQCHQRRRTSESKEGKQPPHLSATSVFARTTGLWCGRACDA